jgi:hypothetical protein
MEGEHPLVLGASFLEEPADQLMFLSRNFVPASAQSAQSATLYTLDGEDGGGDAQTVRAAGARGRRRAAVAARARARRPQPPAPRLPRRVARPPGCSVGVRPPPRGSACSRALPPLRRNAAPRLPTHMHLNPPPYPRQFYMLPAMAPAEAEPIYFQGQLEDANPGGAAGGDLDCVALFDEAAGTWTLEVVTLKLAMRCAGQGRRVRGHAPGPRARRRRRVAAAWATAPGTSGRAACAWRLQP